MSSPPVPCTRLKITMSSIPVQQLKITMSSTPVQQFKITASYLTVEYRLQLAYDSLVNASNVKNHNV